MSGLSKTTPQPDEIKLHQVSKMLEVHFEDGSRFELSCEYLRVFSPSAEVRGHGAGPGVLQLGKENVNIIDIVPVGHYAVKLVFDDGHDSGLYSWDYLYDLGRNQAANWQNYSERVQASKKL